MAKSSAKRRHDEAERTFRRAWKLLDRIEKRLERARAEEQKRLRQYGDGTGPDSARRAAQLEAARAEIGQIEGLLTELSELISSNARASAGQTVKDMAASVAAEIRDEAAEPPTLSTPSERRNRHHRPRRRPEGAPAEAAVPAGDGQAATPADESVAEAEPVADVEAPPAEEAQKRRNRHHRPRRRPTDGGDEPAALEDAPDDGREPSSVAPAAVVGDDVGEDEVGIVVPKRRNRHHRPHRSASAAAASAESSAAPSAPPAEAAPSAPPAEAAPSGDETIAAIPLPPPSLGESVPRSEPAESPAESTSEPAVGVPTAQPATSEPATSSTAEPVDAAEARWIGHVPSTDEHADAAPASTSPDAGIDSPKAAPVDRPAQASGSAPATAPTAGGWTESHARARESEFGPIEPTENREA